MSAETGAVSTGNRTPSRSSVEGFLADIEIAADEARVALADEHEGNFTRAVDQMHALASELHSIIHEW